LLECRELEALEALRRVWLVKSPEDVGECKAPQELLLVEVVLLDDVRRFFRGGNGASLLEQLGPRFAPHNGKEKSPIGPSRRAGDSEPMTGHRISEDDMIK
jgi:hypothetical protein